MTNQEFSNEFDTLLNSYAGSNNFGKAAGFLELDEYEKSVFLTKAQEEIITNFYSGKNQFQESFEKTEEIRRYLSSLIKTEDIKTKSTSNSSYNKISSNSSVFDLPNSLWFITFEGVYVDGLKCDDYGMIAVIPTSQDEYHRIKKNPFRGTTERRALRLDLESNKVEIVVKKGYTIKSYYVRYLEKPKPIIIETLDGVSINGETNKSECSLNPVIHRLILEKAVQLALQSRGINMNKQQ